MLRFRIIIVVGAIAAGLPNAAAQIPDVPGWQLFWHDEFEGTSLNTTNWTALDREDSFNNEKQYYRPEQVTVANGNLQLTATNQPLANKLYRSGLVTSKALYGPGRFEARIDLPTTQGMWPAFWLNANHVPWPQGGEIDIMENRGSQPTLTSSAFHWQKDPGPCCNNWHYVFDEYTATSGGNPVDFTTGFHKYAAEWDTTQIRFYVDGNLHFTVNKTSAMSTANFTTAKNIILNLAVGGNFGGDPNASTVFPQTMLVDYVRVWQRQTGLSGDYNDDGHVDAADYVVWRQTRGQVGIGLPADGSGNGSVGPEDYNVWTASLGSSLLPAAAATVGYHVPEPTTALPMAVGLMLVYAQRLRSGFSPCLGF
ncbi:MAG: glycoside hydrolase family 16 protein [Pirellulales bacterium]